MPAVLDSSVSIHPAALCESQDVGEGTSVWAFAHIMDGAIIGRNCNICDHAFIEGGARLGDGVTCKNQVMVWEGVTVEDGVFLGPAMVFTNDRYPRSARGGTTGASVTRYRHKADWLVPTTVRRGATIGARAVIICGTTIGRYACVGAGAVVTRDVPDHRVVVGNPARVIGWACCCGAPLNDAHTCPECKRRHRIEAGALVAME